MHQRRATDRPASRAYPAQRATVCPGMRRDEVCITFNGRLFAPSILLPRAEAEALMDDLADYLAAAPAPNILQPA